MSNLQEIIKDLRKDTSENIKSFIPLSELYTSVMNDIMLKMKISWGKDPALWNFSRNTTSQLVEINEWVTINGLNDSYVGPINSEVKEDYTKDIAAYNTIRHIVKKEYFETGDFARVNSPLPSMVKFLSTKNLELPIDKLTY